MENKRIYSIYDEYEGRRGKVVVAKQMTTKTKTALHWHDCCEIELVVSGRGTHIINGTPYPMKAGDLYLLTREDFHQVIADDPITTLGIMFDESLVSESVFLNIPLVRLVSPELNVSIGGELYETVKGYFESVIKEESAESENFLSPIYISRLIECIMVELFRALVGISPDLSKKTANEALIYMHKHYAEEITLASLAKEVHLSPNYLSAYFKNTVGKNFKDYLIELRMKHASRLLANTDLSVTDVCFACGFSSYSHFIRTFGNRYGETPLEFRKLHKNRK